MKDTFQPLHLTAFYQPAPEGGFTCGFEELPDVFSQGETLQEAKQNLMEAFELVMEYHREESQKEQISGSQIVRETYDLAPA